MLSIGIDVWNQVDTPVLVGWERFSGPANAVKDALVPVSGFFYAYACSVTLGLALLPDEQYVEAMQASNASIRHGGGSPSASSTPQSRFVPRPGACGPYAPPLALAPLLAHSGSI
jgi:hypothetical protein